MTECTGTTHYEGCPCHEARRDAELEAVKAKADRLEEAMTHIAGMEPGRMGLTQWACVETAKAALAAYREGE